MEEKEQQVNFFHGIEGASAECRNNINLANTEGHQLCEVMDNQFEHLRLLYETFESLSHNTSVMADTLQNLRTRVNQNEKDVTSVNQEYDKFQCEIERLRDLKKELETADDDDGLEQTDDEIVQKDLLRFTKSDADLKRKDLSIMKAKSDKQDSALLKEWRALKIDIKKSREERRYYELQIRNIQNTAIFKFKQLQKLKSDPKEKQQLGRVIDFLQTQRQIENLADDVVDLKVLSCDLENEISELLAWKWSLSKTNDKMDAQLERIKMHEDEEECGHSLHRTVRHIDLPNRDTMKTSPIEMEEDTASRVNTGGYRLHRCQRQTNVSQPLDLIEDVDLLPLRMSEEDISDQSGMLSDVSSELSDFPYENEQCGLDLHRCQKKMDISLPPELLDEGDRALLLSIIQSDGEEESMSLASSLVSDNEILRDINLEVERNQQSPDVTSDDATSDDESMAPHHEGGKELHRCYRSTHIALSPSLVEEMDRCLVLGLNNVEERDILTDTEPSTNSDEEPEQNGAGQEIEGRAQRPDAMYINPANYRFEGHTPVNHLSLVEKLQSSPTGSSTSSSGVTRRAVTAGTGLLGKQSSERKMDTISTARGGRRERR